MVLDQIPSSPWPFLLKTNRQAGQVCTDDIDASEQCGQAERRIFRDVNSGRVQRSLERTGHQIARFSSRLREPSEFQEARNFHRKPLEPEDPPCFIDRL